MTFNELGLKGEVLKSIQKLGFSTPTPIQQKAIPYLLGIHSDFVGLAQTGTGKTAAFGLPLIHNIDDQHPHIQGLVICPTRELCLQITKDLEAYAQDSKHKIVSVYGGADIRRQMKDIQRGCQIVVATPGRLVDLLNRKAVDLNQVDYVVMDEADEMLNMGFKEDIDSILKNTPETKNTWLFSATMPEEVVRISKNYQTNPFEVSIGHRNQSNENITHIYYVVNERDRYEAVKRLLDVHPDIYGLIFCRTRNETATVAEKLGKDGYNAEALHGDLSQQQRDRVMDSFRRKNLQILVATDVAARGIDVDSITHVINYNLPDDIENYTHRSGRTARAGKKGESMVLINLREGYKIKSIEKQMRVTFEKSVIPGAEEICRVQMDHLIDSVLKTKVDERGIEGYVEQINEKFKDLTKEEVVQKFVSAEFNRFLEYYANARDLNPSSQSRSEGRERDKGDRSDFKNSVRFFVNLGKRDGMNPGGLVRLICDQTQLKSNGIGRIEVLPSFSFFEAEASNTDLILQKANGAVYEGNFVSIEVTKNKAQERSGKRKSFSGDRKKSDRKPFGGADRGTPRKNNPNFRKGKRHF